MSVNDNGLCHRLQYSVAAESLKEETRRGRSKEKGMGVSISYWSLNTVADGVLLVVPDAQKLTSGTTGAGFYETGKNGVYEVMHYMDWVNSVDKLSVQ